MKSQFAVVIISIVALLSAFPSAAHNHQIDLDNHCSVDMQGHLSLNQGELRLTDSNQQDVLITRNKELFVDGKKISLNRNEQKWLENYYDSIEAAIPSVITVAREGIRIANYAVSEVLSSLLGENSRTVKMLKDKLETAQRGLDDHLNQDPNYITFDTQTLETDMGVTRDWEKQYEGIVEEIMPEAMGEFLVALGRSMMTGGSVDESFEQRMQRVGDDIEEKVTAQSDLIEKEAAVLCESMKAVEQAEQEIQKIPALRSLDMMTINKRA